MKSTIYKHINLSYLDLMADGDREIKKTIIGMMLDELPNDIAVMKELVHHKKWQEVHQISHKHKSTFPFIGYDVLTESNVELSRITKTEVELGKAPKLIKQIEHHFSIVKDDLHEVFVTL